MSVSDSRRLVVQTDSPEETRALGTRLARSLTPGTCVALYGDLGSGKTCLAQGVCGGLGVSEPVTSPTFILVNEYSGRTSQGVVLPVFHFDLYRLAGPDELADMGWDDYLARDGILLIEWADRAEGLLPSEAVTIAIESPTEGHRQFNISYGE